MRQLAKKFFRNIDSLFQMSYPFILCLRNGSPGYNERQYRRWNVWIRAAVQLAVYY